MDLNLEVKKKMCPHLVVVFDGIEFDVEDILDTIAWIDDDKIETDYHNASNILSEQFKDWEYQDNNNEPYTPYENNENFENYIICSAGNYDMMCFLSSVDILEEIEDSFDGKDEAYFYLKNRDNLRLLERNIDQIMDDNDSFYFSKGEYV